MKISKLFHWLYAILMLLPFAFFVPSVLYYAFNDNATMETVEVPKTKTVGVDFNQKRNQTFGDFVFTNNTSWNSSQVETDDIVVGHIYYVKLNYEITNYVSTTNSSLVFKMGSFGYNSFSFACPINETYAEKRDVLREVTVTSRTTGFQLSPSLTDISFSYSNLQIYDLTQMFGSGNEPTIIEFNQMFPNSYYPYTESELMQITYDTGETEQIVQNTDIVNYAWESIWNLPLFSWCKVSFVATPFTFITGLFGLAPSNSFNYVFTYFASMSIIWLVFDVVLYVPLLVHRWLDKGIVE